MKWILILLTIYGCVSTIQFTREQSARYEKEVSIVMVDNRKAVRVLYDNDYVAYFWLKGDKPDKQAFTLVTDEVIFFDVDYDGWFDVILSGTELSRIGN